MPVRSESEVVAGLEACGYRVMTPEGFAAALNKLRVKVLEGILVPPVMANSLEIHDVVRCRILPSTAKGEGA